MGDQGKVAMHRSRRNDEVVKFEALCRAEGSSKENGLVGYWTVLDIHLPQALEARRDTVLELIRDGLEAMGNSIGQRDELTQVNIQFQ